MEFLTNKQLANYVSMRLGGPATEIVAIHNEKDVVKACDYATSKSLPVLTLGSGTNIIFKDAGFNGVVLLNKIPGLTVDGSTGLVEAGGGVSWDKAVEQAIGEGLCGIESLTHIPGTCGAAPINNIGAYGQELKDTFDHLRAYDTKARTFIEIFNKDCDFSYRNSRFKAEDYGRYIICKIYLKLQKTPPDYTPPNYPSLLKELSGKSIDSPQPLDVRESLITLRGNRLPDVNKEPNTGSFYKNPIVTKSVVDNLLNSYPDMPHYPLENDKEKLAAGWLIDKAGLRGYRRNGIWIYDKQALVIVNESAKSYAQLQQMSDLIVATVNQKFGINLKIEPEII